MPCLSDRRLYTKTASHIPPSVRTATAHYPPTPRVGKILMIVQPTTSSCWRSRMKLSLGRRHHPSSSPCLLRPRAQPSLRKRWHRDTSTPSSRRNAGLVLVRTGVSFCVRCVSSNRALWLPLTQIAFPACPGRKSPWCAAQRLLGAPVGMNLYFSGRFAVKKIAVGESHTYLVDILREVRLLEELRHPNIVTYHHSWLETTQFSPFGPKVPALLYVPSLNPRLG